jgi:hypothetical protein
MKVRVYDGEGEIVYSFSSSDDQSLEDLVRDELGMKDWVVEVGPRECLPDIDTGFKPSLAQMAARVKWGTVEVLEGLGLPSVIEVLRPLVLVPREGPDTSPNPAEPADETRGREVPG